MTIKRTMLALLALVSVLLLIAQGELFRQAYERYNVSGQATISNMAVDGLLDAGSLWAKERGTTNSALGSPDPASTETLKKIAAARESADKNLENALNKANEAGLIVEGRYRQDIDKAIASVKVLRETVDANLSKPKAERDAELMNKWMPGITALIVETQKLRINLGSQALTQDASLGKDTLIRHSVWLMTEYAGRERGLIAGVIASGEPISPDQLQQLLSYRGKVEEGWSMLTNIYETKEEHAAFDGPIDNARADYFGSFEKVRQTVYSDAKLGLGYNMSAKDWIDRSTQAIDGLGKIKETSTSAINSMLTQNRSSANNNMILYGASLLVSILAVIGALWVVLGRVTGPINTLSDSMTAIASGALENQVPYLKRTDEMGHMAKSVEIFRKNGLEKIRLETQAKEAEQASREEKKRMMQKLASDFESGVQGIVATVASASTQLYQTAENMKHTVTTVSQQSGIASAASEQTSSNVQSISAAVEEMSASVKEIANQVTKSSAVVNEAVTKTSQADQSTQTLSQAVGQISGILQFIQEIADQINLLALNATIESARAGEAGKGFAVVASEVKNLAGQTTKATEEITKQIKSVQHASTEVVDVLKGIQLAISNISQYSSGIASAVEQQSSVTVDISSNMHQAANGVKEITSNITFITQGASDANDAAQEVLTAAQMLSKQSELLNQQVKVFLDAMAA